MAPAAKTPPGTPPEVLKLSERVATPCAADWARCKLLQYAAKNRFVLTAPAEGGLTSYRGTWAFADPRPWLWMWTDSDRQVRRRFMGSPRASGMFW